MDEQVLYNLNINYSQNQRLATQLLPLARKFLSDPSKLTNEWNYKNTYSDGVGLASELEIQFFVDYILEQSYNYLAKNKLELKPNVELYVSLFASEMIAGDEHSPHTHPGALLSGIIYLQTPPDSSALEFKSPRTGNSSWLNYLEESSYTSKGEIISISANHTIIIDPQPGLFLLWESWAMHRVPKNQSTEPRLTMVFNVGVRDKTYEKL